MLRGAIKRQEPAARMAEVEHTAVEGTVGSLYARTTKAGSPYLTATVTPAVGEGIRCWWFDALPSLSNGDRVAVTGRAREGGGLVAERTKFFKQQPFERRLLDFYQACLELEAARFEELRLSDRSVLSLTAGVAPFGDRETSLPEGAKTERWVTVRRTAGEAETLLAGYPLVTPTEYQGQGTPQQGASLLTTEVRLVVDGDRKVLRATSLALELNEPALAMLGLSSEERQEAVAAFDAGIARAPADDRLQAALSLLVELGIEMPPSDPAQLVGFRPGSMIHDVVVVRAVTGTSGAVTRALFRDFEELRTVPVDQLRQGPLGILLGTIDRPAVELREEPSPAVLLANLEQEQAVNAAVQQVLKVVTGPPGAGKSQVLVNATAAALAAGQTVLLASKNNHAIDVVVDRIRACHPDAAPVRIGNQAVLADAAAELGRSLARATTPELGLSEAERSWTRVQERVRRPYAQLHERRRLTKAFDEQVRRCRQVRDELPADLRTVHVEVDRELLVAAHQKATRLDVEATAAPARWFWQRRRRRKVEHEADAAATTAVTLGGVEAQPVLTQVLLSEGRSAVLDLLARVLRVADEDDLLARCRLEVELLPDPSEIEGEIERSFPERLEAARELFAAGWKDRYRCASSPGRPAALAYEARLATLSHAGEARQLRAEVPGVLRPLPVWATDESGLSWAASDAASPTIRTGRSIAAPAASATPARSSVARPETHRRGGASTSRSSSRFPPRRHAASSIAASSRSLRKPTSRASVPRRPTSVGGTTLHAFAASVAGSRSISMCPSTSSRRASASTKRSVASIWLAMFRSQDMGPLPTWHSASKAAAQSTVGLGRTASSLRTSRRGGATAARDRFFARLGDVG